MGRISSNIGLITGIPITDTVEQLMAVAGAPRDLLVSRNENLQQEQLAINTLSSRLLGLQFDLSKLKDTESFESRTVTSQNPDVVAASLNSKGNPAVAEYQIRTVQTASAQQLVSQRFEDLDDIQDAGKFSFGFGSFVNQGIALDDLNGGTGIVRGKIKISDLSGSSAVVDLSYARTVDDVLEAINAEERINIRATARGDHFELTDTLGGSGSLRVQEVSGGTTAADLGLAGIDTSSQVASGEDIYWIHAGTKLSQLNDGNGVRIIDDLNAVDDLSIALADGTSAGVDLSGATTVGDLIKAIEGDEDFSGKVSVSLGSDGNRLEVKDLTTGTQGFTIANGLTGSTADDLGLTTSEVGGVIIGNRLVSGLRDSLLSRLDGGAGLGPLGSLSITDRTGASDPAVDLSAAQTLGDVLEAINQSATNVVADFNASGTGISIASAGSGDFTISSADATNSAELLGVVIQANQGSIDSGSLNRQSLSEATPLAQLRGGSGVTPNDLQITDTNGVTIAIDLNSPELEVKSIGDVIDAINFSTAGVEASINQSGDGILITDTALGSGELEVRDLSGTLAADLNLTGTSQTIDLQGVETQVIDGTSRYSVDLSDLEVSAESIRLDSLHEGVGVALSDIKIEDSRGSVLALDLNGEFSGISTVGDLIDVINTEAAARGVEVTAKINSSKSGILLVDTGGGAGTLSVEDLNGTTAADLKILSSDNTTNTINGAGLFSAGSEGKGALDSIANRINALDSGVTASTFYDGIGHRLSLVVKETGSSNKIFVDAGDTGFEFTETATARDALITFGEQQAAGSGVLISSSNNDFFDVIPGVNLTAVAAQEQGVAVTVSKTDADLVSYVEDFVASYNSIRSDLNELTVFDEADLSTGLLFGTNEALRVDTVLSRLVTDRYSQVGEFKSLQEIGIQVDDQGNLQLNTSELRAAFAENPESLQTLFTDENNGIVARFDAALEQLAGNENGLLSNRNDTLQSTIDVNQSRIDRFNESLERQRERLFLQFFQLEEVIASLQQGQSALAALQPLAPL